jgi:hypothetical protein
VLFRSTGVLTPTGIGKTNITYTYTDGNNCTNSDTKTVTVHDLPTVTITNAPLPLEVCLNSNMTMTGSPTGGSWASETPSVATINSGTGVLTPVTVGTTDIIYTYTDGYGCVNSDTVNVRIKPLYTITATVSHGTISPAGAVIVCENHDQTFTFEPDFCYEMNEVLIDGAPVTVTGDSYTFTDVTDDHTIHVTFAKIPYTVTLSADPPAGAVSLIGAGTFD